MVSPIEQHRHEIQELCRRFRVRRLDLFGSAARGIDFDTATSDFDFLVEFEDLGWKGSFKRYMGLKLELEALLAQRVDLIEADAIENLLFLNVVSQDRRTLYAA